MNNASGTMVTAYRATAWAMVVIVVLGYVSLIPAFAGKIDAIQATAPGRALIGAALVFCALDAIVMWGAAMWYAWSKGPDGALPRGARVALLMVGNFVFAFFYYFIVVAREHKAAASRA